MTDAQAARELGRSQSSDELAAHRLRNLLRQFALSRANAAMLLRALAAELDGQPVDAHIRDAAEREAQRLCAEGFTVTDLRVTTLGAAHVLDRAPKTLRSWRSCAVGPRWHADGAGRVSYSLLDLVAWRSGDVPTCPDF